MRANLITIQQLIYVDRPRIRAHTKASVQCMKSLRLAEKQQKKFKKKVYIIKQFIMLVHKYCIYLTQRAAATANETTTKNNKKQLTLL